MEDLKGSVSLACKEGERAGFRSSPPAQSLLISLELTHNTLYLTQQCCQQPVSKQPAASLAWREPTEREEGSPPLCHCAGMLVDGFIPILSLSYFYLPIANNR